MHTPEMRYALLTCKYIVEMKSNNVKKILTLKRNLNEVYWKVS